MVVEKIGEQLASMELDIRRLAAIMGEIHSRDRSAPATSEAGVLSIVRAEQRALDLRFKICPPAARDQVGWEILLAAYHAHCNGREFPFTALSSFAHAPTTTASRWTTELERVGLLQRRADEEDRRRHRVSISQAGIATVQSYAAGLGAA